MFKCVKCGVDHSRCRGRYSAVPQSYCATCHAEHMRRTRPPYKKLSLLARFKNVARSYANVYQRRGKLIHQLCEKCGAVKAEKHHDDYSKPLSVKWFCKPCHHDHHYELGDSE